MITYRMDPTSPNVAVSLAQARRQRGRAVGIPRLNPASCTHTRKSPYLLHPPSEYIKQTRYNIGDNNGDLIKAYNLFTAHAAVELGVHERPKEHRPTLMRTGTAVKKPLAYTFSAVSWLLNDTECAFLCAHVRRTHGEHTLILGNSCII